MFPVAWAVFLTIWAAQGECVHINNNNNNTITIRPRDCQDLIQQGKTYEGHYVVYPEASAPNTASMIYCSQHDGMEMLPSDKSSEFQARSCMDLLQDGMTITGPNIIYPVEPDPYPTVPVLVYCDQETDGGGWTVIQKRFDGSLDFYREYLDWYWPFGNVAQEHYLGHNYISLLTEDRLNELRIELEDWDGITVYAHYQAFNTMGGYHKLKVFSYSGTAGDSLFWDAGTYFSAYDLDNDDNRDVNCAEL